MKNKSFSKKTKIVLIGGTKGVGKSTVVNKIKSELKDFIFINSGELLNNQSQLKYQISFTQLPNQQKPIIRNLFAKQVLEHSTSNLIIDLHYGEFENGGYPCVVPKVILSIATHFIIITSTIEKIVTRRIKDKKIRHLDETSIRLNLLGEKLIFNQLIKKHTQVKHLIMPNTTVNSAVNKIINFIIN